MNTLSATPARKLVSILLTFVLAFSLSPISAYADEPSTQTDTSSAQPSGGDATDDAAKEAVADRPGSSGGEDQSTDGTNSGSSNDQGATNGDAASAPGNGSANDAYANDTNEDEGIDLQASGVCRIGSTYYETLKAAFDAAKEGDTVVLTADCESGSLYVEESITLDLAGHSVTRNTTTTFYPFSFYVQDGVTFTLDGSAGGGSINGESGVQCDGWNSVFVMNGGNINVENYGVQVDDKYASFYMNGGSINSKSWGIDLNANPSYVYLNNGTVTATKSAVTLDDDTTIFKMNGGSLNSTEKPAIWVSSYEKDVEVTVNNGTVTSSHDNAIRMHSCRGSLNISGGSLYGGFWEESSSEVAAVSVKSFTGKVIIQDGELNGPYAMAVDFGGSGKVYAKGGTFESRYHSQEINYTYNDYDAIEVSAGKFKHEVPENQRPGYYSTLLTDGWYSVVANPVASIKRGSSTFYYATLADAFNMASTGETIKVISDYLTDNTLTSGAITVPSSKNLTLDLGSAKLAQESGTDALFTLEGGLTINGDGAAITSTGATFKLGQYGNLDLPGKVSYSAPDTIVQVDGAHASLTISDGTFATTSTHDKTIYFSDAALKTATVKVTGGAYESFDPHDTPAQHKNLLPEYYISILNGTTYTVGDSSFTATDPSGNVTYYSSLDAAITGAKSGSTVKVNRDFVDNDSTDSYVVKSSKSITLDLNGHTCEINPQYAWFKEDAIAVYFRGSLTIEDTSEAGTGVLKSHARAIYLENPSSFTLKSGTIEAESYCIYAQNESTLSITGGKLLGGSTANIKTKDTKFITGGTFSFRQPDESIADGYSQVKNLDGTYTVGKDAVTVTFDANGGTLSGSDSATVDFGQTVAPPEDKPTRSLYHFVGWSTSKDGADLFNFISPITSNITLYAVWKPYTCTIGSQGYLSLQNAFNAANDGETITMVTDQTLESPATVSGKNVTLDLNGKKINAENGNAIEIASDAELGITDSAGGGEITSSATAITVSSGKGLKLEAGTITGRVAGVFNNAGNANVEISGGSVTGKLASVMVGVSAYNSTLTFTDGTFSATTAVLVIPDSATIDVKGGKFTSTNSTVPTDIYSYGTEKAYISGGLFSKQVATEQCAEGCIPVDNTDAATKDAYPYKVAKGYKVTFDANGGVFTGDADQTVIEGDCATKPTVDPTRDGYVFKGWSSEEGGSEEFDFTTPISADTTLYAMWDSSTPVVKHTVTFDANGGQLSCDPTVDVVTAGLLTKPADPTYPVGEGEPGYAFNGWYTAATGGEAYNFNSFVFNSFTLYAQWTQKNVAVTNGGETTYYATLQEAVDAAEAGSTIKMLSDVTLDTFVFLQDKDVTLDLNGKTITGNFEEAFSLWANGGSLIITDTSEAKNGQIIGAAVELYDVDSFTLNAGNIGSPEVFFSAINVHNYSGTADITINGGSTNSWQNGIALFGEGITLTVNDGTIAGDSWAIQNGGEDPTKNTISIKGGSFSSNQTLGKSTPQDISNKDAAAGFIEGGVFKKAVPYEQCADGYVPVANTDEATKDAYPYTVTQGYAITLVDESGAYTGDAQLFVKKGESATAPEDPTRDGYDFAGWTIDEAGTQSFSFDDPVNANTTLYAQWKLHEYKITYNLDGGTNSQDNPDSYTLETEDIQLKDATKAGYEFAGWKDAQGNAITTIPQGSSGDIALTATWTKTYTVSFDGNGGTLAEGTEDQSVKGGEVPTQPNDPTRDGYAFKGWTTDKDGTQPFSFDTPVSADTTLYAQWLVKVTKPQLNVGSLTYNGTEQTGATMVAGIGNLGMNVFTAGDAGRAGQYTLNGTVKATNVGSYTASIVLRDKENTVWEDGTTDDIVGTWNITHKTLEITVDDVSIRVGEAFELTGTVEGIADADKDKLVVKYVLEPGADTSKAGTYQIFADTDADAELLANYHVHANVGTLTVTDPSAPDPKPDPEPTPTPDPGTDPDNPGGGDSGNGGSKTTTTTTTTTTKSTANGTAQTGDDAAPFAVAGALGMAALATLAVARRKVGKQR